MSDCVLRSSECQPVGGPVRLGQALARMSPAVRLRLPAPPLFRANARPNLAGNKRGGYSTVELRERPQEQVGGRSEERLGGQVLYSNISRDVPGRATYGSDCKTRPDPDTSSECQPVGGPVRLGQALARMSPAVRLRLPAPPLFRANARPSLAGNKRGGCSTVELRERPQEQVGGRSAQRQKGGVVGPRPTRGTAAELSAHRPASTNPLATDPRLLPARRPRTRADKSALATSGTGTDPDSANQRLIT